MTKKTVKDQTIDVLYSALYFACCDVAAVDSQMTEEELIAHYIEKAKFALYPELKNTIQPGSAGQTNNGTGGK